MKTSIFVGIPIDYFINPDKQVMGYEYFFDNGTLAGYGKKIDEYQTGMYFIDMDEFIKSTREIGKEVYKELKEKDLLSEMFKFPQVFIVNEE